MNPLTLFLLDGTAFFAGLCAVLLSGPLLLFHPPGPFRAVLTASLLAGIAAVLLSAVPLPEWAYFLWVACTLAALLPVQWTDAVPGLRIRAATLLLAATAGLLLAELPRLRSPRLRNPDDVAIVVIGDSISAGIGTGERVWPEVLAELISRRVENRARPGATTRDAMQQASALPGSGTLVLLEIGGNDLLKRTNATAFRQHLDLLLAALRADGHDVLMFELPLFPFQNAYGRAQRTLARRHGVTLLPRRHFARALGRPGGTLDGIHLSQAGHDELARRLAAVLAPRRPAGPPATTGSLLNGQPRGIIHALYTNEYSCFSAAAACAVRRPSP